MSSDSNHEISYFKADRLKQAREQRGWSQRDLSRMLKIGVNQINTYENGGGEPSSRILYLIAKQLEVTVDYLLGLSDTPQGYSAGDLSQDEMRLLHAFKHRDSATIVRLLAERLNQSDAEQPEQ